MTYRRTDGHPNVNIEQESAKQGLQFEEKQLITFEDTLDLSRDQGIDDG